MGDSITGYLLTRAWCDTPNGVELTLWGATDAGPLRLVIEQQEAVCFINRSRSLPLPVHARRQCRELKLLGGEPVDALYLRQQRDLQALRQSSVVLAESLTGLFCMSRRLTRSNGHSLCLEQNDERRMAHKLACVG
jgi:DNA polymerase II, N-terminal